MLKKSEYQENIISTNIRSFSQLQQQMQAGDIQEKVIIVSINLPNVEGTSEKLQPILKSHKITSPFYSESILHKFLCKLKY